MTTIKIAKKHGGVAAKHALSEIIINVMAAVCSVKQRIVAACRSIAKAAGSVKYEIILIEKISGSISIIAAAMAVLIKRSSASMASWRSIAAWRNDVVAGGMASWQRGGMAA